MSYAPDRADSVRFKVAGVEIQHLTAIGTVGGVTIAHVAAANGKGVGRLRKTAAGELQWRPPGASGYGPAVPIPSDDTYRLESDTEPAKWLRVAVQTAFFAVGEEESRVFLTDVYSNAVSSDDVTYSEAAAGDVETYTITAVNEGLFPAYIQVWIENGPGLEISNDGAAWVAPTGPFGALTLSPTPVNPSGTATLYVRRTITAGASPDAGVLAHLVGLVIVLT